MTRDASPSKIPSSSPTTERRALVVGAVASRELALPQLASLDAKPTCLDWHEPLAERIDDQVSCIVLAGTPPTADLDRHIRTLRELVTASGRELPPVLVAADVSDHHARELYRAGAALVAPLTPRATQGPSLAEIGRELIPRALAAELVDGPARSVDEALTRQAQLRLRLASPRYAQLQVEVRDGIATVRGALGILWRRVHVERVLSLMPGLDDVLVEDVRIDSRRTDDHLEDRVTHAIDAELGGHDTVTWSLDGGRVVFAGSVASRDAMTRLIAAVRRMRGVRGIRNNLVVSPSQTERDGEVARRVAQRLDSLGVDEEVDAGVVGQFAVLRGSVADEGRKKLVENAVKGVRGIDRVVDELEIAP